METFIRGMPKAELHVHLEGCLEPELMFALAERNGLTLRWNSPELLQAAYEFRDLGDFLALFYEGCCVVRTEQDFYDLTRHYLRRAFEDRVLRAEMFLGPQNFPGVPVATLMTGALNAITDSQREFGISAGLLITAHRHKTEAEALAVLDSVLPWADRITGFGMGGPEVGNPPSKFINFFARCRELGFPICIHAGEEGPASYVREAADVLRVNRIDHGNACMDDEALRDDLARRGLPLTVCPLSNIRLHVEPSLAQHPLRVMLDAGLNVSVHSDDPPYFGGYINDNLIACQQAMDLSRDDMITLARNSFNAAFLPHDQRVHCLAALDAWCRTT